MVEESVEIAAPPEKVWKIFTEEQKLAELESRDQAGQPPERLSVEAGMAV